ncbi:thiol-disulfide isomerase [Weissella coleopterorum]|uniref:Thiol-disulfide isomerase n=1 Tax=Weissella coleopterorum TaxID=2714949 RepID=A0A6G8AY93_9LACO|nr:thiol-disulfide isomerase [Weissella coleopterorum]QIL49922.1 thiol-disulfide isomerase [Weissella coleopterorum]
MRRVSLLKKDRKGSSKSSKSGSGIFSRFNNLTVALNGVAVLIVLLIAGYFFTPYFSMHFMNNQAVPVSSSKVLFYNSDCEACERVYPVVFWDNILHKTDVQTINLKVADNKHYVDDDVITSTPTIIDFDNNRRISITDKQEIKDFIDN